MYINVYYTYICILLYIVLSYSFHTLCKETWFQNTVSIEDRLVAGASPRQNSGASGSLGKECSEYSNAI
jgi:hypothetical protein